MVEVLLQRVFIPIAVAALLATPSLSAAATAQRTFVASTGADTNACTISAPCRGFAAAIARTTAGGEVLVLDSAGYGPVTITQAVSLIAPTGIYAGVSVASGIGIDVNAALSDNVVLRGLTITGTGGATGIQFRNGRQLRIENCVVANFISAGVVQNISGSEMIIVDSTVRNNGGAGILVIADASARLDRVRVENNVGDGLYVVSSNGTPRVHVNHSFIARNGANGIHADSTASAGPVLQVDSSDVVENGASGFLATASQTFASVYATLTHNTFNQNAAHGVHWSGTGSLVSVFGRMTANDMSNNAMHGIFLHGSGDITLSANSGGGNGLSALRCDNAAGGLRSLGNNSLDSTNSIGGCLFTNPPV